LRSSQKPLIHITLEPIIKFRSLSLSIKGFNKNEDKINMNKKTIPHEFGIGAEVSKSRFFRLPNIL
jgi:hypothetical protein